MLQDQETILALMFGDGAGLKASTLVWSIVTSFLPITTPKKDISCALNRYLCLGFPIA